MSQAAQVWNPRGSMPEKADRYEIRCFQTVEMVSEAQWDGQVWRYLKDGRPCYFQNPEWRKSDQPKFA